MCKLESAYPKKKMYKIEKTKTKKYGKEKSTKLNTIP
jgi:hypothetical protein